MGKGTFNLNKFKEPSSKISTELKGLYSTCGTDRAVDYDGFKAYRKSFNAYQEARKKYPLGADIEDMKRVVAE